MEKSNNKIYVYKNLITKYPIFLEFIETLYDSAKDLFIPRRRIEKLIIHNFENVKYLDECYFVIKFFISYKRNVNYSTFTTWENPLGQTVIDSISEEHDSLYDVYGPCFFEYPYKKFAIFSSQITMTYTQSKFILDLYGKEPKLFKNDQE